MTWSDYKYVLREIEDCKFDITEDQLHELTYEFLQEHVVFTDLQIERFAMMKGAD